MAVELTAATFNLHWGTDRRGVPFDLPGALATIDADIVCLQEVWQPPGGANIAERAAGQLGYRDAVFCPLTDRAVIAGLRVLPAPAPEAGSWGIAVLARTGLQLEATVPLPGTRWDPVSRVALVCTVGSAEGTTRVVTAHLSHRWPTNLRQLGRLLQLARGARASLVLGDLNCPGVVVRRIARDYVDGATEATWPARRPVAQLDHVLIGPGVAVKGASTLSQEWSDHRAVRVVLAR